jgi:hypothetical protein
MSDWYYAKGKQQFGPVSTDQLKMLAASGELTSQDQLWRPGMASWTAAAQVKGLFAASGTTTTTRPPPLPPRPTPSPDSASMAGTAVSMEASTTKRSGLSKVQRAAIGCAIGGLCVGAILALLSSRSPIRHEHKIRAPNEPSRTHDRMMSADASLKQQGRQTPSGVANMPTAKDAGKVAKAGSRDGEPEPIPLVKPTTEANSSHSGASTTATNQQIPQRQASSNPAEQPFTTRNFLLEARKIALSGSVEDATEKTVLLADIATVQAKVGEVEDAWATIRLAKSLGEMSNTLVEGPVLEVARAQAERGKYQIALSTAKTLPSSFFRCLAIAAVAKSQFRAGDVSGSNKTLEIAISESRNAFDESEALLQIVRTFAELGYYSRARQLIGTLPEAYKHRGMESIAVAQAEAGKGIEAWNTYANNGCNDDLAILLMVKAFARHGQFDAAEYVLSAFVIPEWQSQAICAVVSAEVKVGLLDRARRTMLKNGDVYIQIPKKNAMFKSIAAAMAVSAIADLRGVEQAQGVALLASAEFPKGYNARPFLSLAEFTAASREPHKAQGYFRLALSMIGEMPDKYSEEKASLYREAAETQARSGCADLVRTWVKEIKLPSIQAHALIGAAEGLSEYESRMRSDSPVK